MFQPSKETQEKRQHGTAYIPYSFYECHMPHYFPNIPMHWHSELEIDFITRGSGVFFCGREKYMAGVGDLFFLAPNLLHAAQPDEGGELICAALVFRPSLLDTDSRDRCSAKHILPITSGARRFPPRIPSDAGSFPALQACAREIFSCSPFCTDGPPRVELLLKSALLRFLWLLETDRSLPSAAGEQTADSAVRPALNYMMQHFRDPISVSQLAACSHISPSRFAVRFRETTGMSAVQYLTQLRIHAACESLCAEDEKIAAIALNSGFQNLSNFNRQFKKAMNLSPCEYRKRHRAADGHG